METNEFFSFYAVTNSTRTTIAFNVSNGGVRTGFYPETMDIVKKFIPGVLKTKCFNERHNSFDVEVVNTEIAHLFEHIVIQSICEIRKSKGLVYCKYHGETEWDWSLYNFGNFKIVINACLEDTEELEGALMKASSIVKSIMASSFVPVKV